MRVAGVCVVISRFVRDGAPPAGCWGAEGDRDGAQVGRTGSGGCWATVAVMASLGTVPSSWDPMSVDHRILPGQGHQLAAARPPGSNLQQFASPRELLSLRRIAGRTTVAPRNATAEPAGLRQDDDE